jgi:L-ascorbate metabolism protein UlaG (beta-lactamase superfamily)
MAMLYSPQMRVLLISLVALAAASQPPRLEARFIGNMALALTDGRVTVMTDFPYQSGYSVYMEYPASEIRSPTPMTLSLITHRHGDHWEPSLFLKTDWRVAGPNDVVSAVPAARVLPLSDGATFGPVQIQPIPTPHANIGHNSYLVSWHGRRLYFTGDTETIDKLLAARNLDVAFVSPWNYRSVVKKGARIDTRRVVIYHHEAGETIAECRDNCHVPRQGETIAIP